MKLNHVHHQTHLEKPLPPAPDPPTLVQPLQQWRQQSLLNLLRVALVLAVPVLALDIYSAIQAQRIAPTIFYVISYGVLVGLVAMPRVPNLVRVLYFLSLLYLIGLAELLSYGIVVSGILFMLTFVVVASLFLDVRGVIITGSIAFVTVIGTIVVTEQVLPLMDQIIAVALLVLFTSMIVSLTLTLTHTLLASLRRAEDLALMAQAAQHHAEQNAAALAEQQAAIVQARDAAVAAHAEAEQARQEVQQQLAVVQQQQALIRELSVPVLPLTEHTLVLPLVGSLDVERVAQITGGLLEQVVAYHARLVILDITGIAELDRSVAQALLETLRGVQLLGAQVVLTGIQPRTAHALVQLGVALNGIRTYHTLQAGVAESIPAVRY